MKTLESILPGIIEFRRQIHRHPEIAGEEYETQKKIRAYLKNIPGLEVLPPFLKTDTVAILRGDLPGPNVTLRADIDALAIQEKTGLPFASEVPGMMHACGHDVHTAILMGAAELLAEKRAEIKGSVRFVWQPGEESKALAKPLLEAGAIDDPKPDCVAALHCSPDYPAGKISSKAGAMHASGCHFRVTFRGKGGHGSRLDLARNPVTAAAYAATELQSVVSNRLSPFKSGVISICEIHGGHTDNVIPDEAWIAGTIRALDNDTADMLRNSLIEVCELAAKMHRTECEISARQSYLSVSNDPELVELLAETCKKEGLPFLEEKLPSMGSEDFCYFVLRAPGCLFHLGGGSGHLHQPEFIFDESSLPAGIRAMTAFALAFLEKKAAK